MSFEKDSTLVFKLPRREAAAFQSEPHRHFALILYPPADIADTFDAIRARFDPAFAQNIPAHITIKRPVLLPNDDVLPEMARALSDVVAAFPVFPVELDGVGAFDNPENTAVFIKVRDTRPLASMHMALLQRLAQFLPNGGADGYEGSNYHPHLTIGNSLTPTDRDLLLREMGKRRARTHFRFPVQDIALLVEAPLSDQLAVTWQHYSLMPLGQVYSTPLSNKRI